MQPLRLVIGYGNTLRQDDGVGYRVAETLIAHPPTLNFCQLQALAVHQLTPDLAAAVAVAREVIFVDLMFVTGNSEPRVQLQPLSPLNRTADGNTHSSDPHHILYLSERLFGVVPPSYWLLIPGTWSGFGEDLSPLAQRGLQEALALVQRPQL